MGACPLHVSHYLRQVLHEFAVTLQRMRQVFADFVEDGCINLEYGNKPFPLGHGGLRLTDLSPPVLRGEARLWMRRDAQPEKAKKTNVTYV